MSLSRAFTTSRRKLGLDIDSATPSFMKRSNTTKAAEFRPKISGPVELIHTTNILTYSAPDLPRASRSNSASSAKTSDSDSETVMTAESTPPTSPDVSPGERDCASPTPEPNHLSCYFQTPKQTVSPDPSAPAIPKRSPSHTKKSTYEALARRSPSTRQSRDSDMSSASRPGLTFSRASSTSTRASSASHMSSAVAQKSAPSTPPAASTKESHPFGQELAQVSELAEEYGNKLKPIDEEEEVYLSSRGLAKFSADDYLGLVQSLSNTFFAEHSAAPAPLWI